jgi:hypothetical protein
LDQASSWLIIIQMVNLFLYFTEFIEVTPESIDEAMMDGECPSMTGETGIEPDGHDSDGWPSILAAAGIILSSPRRSLRRWR